MIRGLIDSARRGQKLRMISGPSVGGWGTFPFGTLGEGLDYHKEAGLCWDNSIVWACMSFGARILNACPILTGLRDKAGAFTPIEAHPISRLLDRPNDWYDGTVLQSAQIMGEMGKPGNSYAYIHRSGAGIPFALEALPEGACYPYTEPGSGDFITEYRVITTSGYKPYRPEDILHLSWMIRDPRDIRIGLSPLEACLPEVVSDKKTGRIRAALLSNSGVSSTVIAPKASAGEEAEFTTAQERQIKNKIRDTVSGDNVGLPLVFSMPVDVQRLAFDPSQLGLESVTKHDEERICAVYGIMPLAVCLGAGLSQQNNRAGAQSAIDATFDSFVLPYMEHREKQLTDRLVPELAQPGEDPDRLVVRYDRSRIAAIKARLVREIMAKTGGPVETPNEGRGQLGLGPVEGGDVLRSPKGSAPIGPSGPGETDSPPDDLSDGDE